MIWTVYLAVLALLYVSLSMRIVGLRRRLRLSLGDGGHPLLLRAIRVHANFAEYVPLGVLLIAAVEQSQAPRLLVHLLGVCLVAGRLLHAYGVSRESENFRFRVAGMSLTMLCFLLAAGSLLLAAVLPLL